MYCVVMGDIIDSQKIVQNDRELIREIINRALDSVNCDYRTAICVPFRISRGDAIEGILYSSYYAIDIALKIVQCVYIEKRVRLRISIATGQLTTMSTISDECDGPAFHTASKELNELKKLYKPLETRKRTNDRMSLPWFQIRIKTGEPSELLINSLLSMLSLLTQTWTEKQTETVWTAQELMQQKLVAKKMNVSVPTVSNQLRAARYSEYVQAIESIKQFFSDIEEFEVTNLASCEYNLYYSVGRRYERKCEYAIAIENFNTALEKAKKQSVNELFLIPIFNCLAQAYIEYADRHVNTSAYLDKAKSALDSSIEIQTRMLGLSFDKNIPAMLMSNDRIVEEGWKHIVFDYIQTLILEGNYCIARGNWQGAIEIFTKASKLSEKKYGQFHHLTDVCYSNLAIAYKMSPQGIDIYRDGIEECYKRSVDYAKQHQGVDPTNYADSLYNLGQFYQAIGKYDDAYSTVSSAEEIYRLVLHKGNPLLTEVASTLGEIEEARKSN